MSCAALLRSFAVLIIATLLSGCVTRTGFDYAAVMQKVGPPPRGHSRIVVLSEKPVANSGHAELTIDGVPTKNLSPGTYVYLDRPAGKHQIVATQALFMGETRQELTTTPGRTYFLVARHSDRHAAVMRTMMVAGIAGALAATAMTAGSKNPGPVDLFPLDEATARTTLADLQLAE